MIYANFGWWAVPNLRYADSSEDLPKMFSDKIPEHIFTATTSQGMTRPEKSLSWKVNLQNIKKILTMRYH